MRKALTFLAEYNESPDKKLDRFGAPLEKTAGRLAEKFDPAFVINIFSEIDRESYEIGSYALVHKSTRQAICLVVTGKVTYYALADTEPATIEEFVSDCLRAGLELNWTGGGFKHEELLL